MAQVHLLLGLVARRQGNYGGAIEHYQAGLALIASQTVQSAEIATVITDLYIGLSNVLRQQGEYEQAQVHCHHALTLCQTWENRRSEADVFNTLGIIAYYMRSFGTARAYHQQALKRRRMISDLAGEGVSLYNLASVDYEEARFTTAGDLINLASDIQEAAGNRWEQVNIANLWSMIRYQLGDYVGAYDELHRGLQLCETIGDEVGRGYLLCNLGQVFRDLGNNEAAFQVLHEGIRIAREHKDQHLYAMGLSHQAMVCIRQHKPTEAMALARCALYLY